MAFSYAAKITIKVAYVVADMTDVPIPIKVTDDRFKLVSNGGYVECPGGLDIVFSASPDGSNPFPHQIDEYDGETGTILFWVEVPYISSSQDTEFYVCFGDPSISSTLEDARGTWDGEDYRLSHRLRWSPEGRYYDATLYDNDYLRHTDYPTDVDTPYYRGVYYPGDKARWLYGASGHTDLNPGTQPFVLRIWMRCPPDKRLYFWKVQTTSPWYTWGLACANGQYLFRTRNDAVVDFYSQYSFYDDDQWHLVTAQRTSNGVCKIYVDRLLENVSDLEPIYNVIPSGTHYLGTNYDTPPGISTGYMDEPRVIFGELLDMEVQTLDNAEIYGYGTFWTLDETIPAGRVQSSFTADAIFRKTSEGSLSADATLLKAISNSIQADAILLDTQEHSITADARIVIESTVGARRPTILQRLRRAGQR